MKTGRSWLVPTFLTCAYLLVPACMIDLPVPLDEQVSSTMPDEDEASSSSTETVNRPPPGRCDSLCTSTEQCIDWCNDAFVECVKFPQSNHGTCWFSLTDQPERSSLE